VLLRRVWTAATGFEKHPIMRRIAVIEVGRFGEGHPSRSPWTMIARILIAGRKSIVQGSGLSARVYD
jgi:hypothetical protein